MRLWVQGALQGRTLGWLNQVVDTARCRYFSALHWETDAQTTAPEGIRCPGNLRFKTWSRAERFYLLKKTLMTLPGKLTADSFTCFGWQRRIDLNSGAFVMTFFNRYSLFPSF